MTVADISEAIFQNEDAARAYLESIRWPHGPYCPRCGETEEIKRLAGKLHAAGVFHCRACRRKFTVRIGSVYEHSHVPLHKWLAAAHLIRSSKRGISAYQLHRILGLTYKTTLSMAHRIRRSKDDALVDRNGGLGGMGELNNPKAAPASRRKAPLIPRAERSTLQDRVYQMLKRSIMSGVLVPGETVSIRSLATALGTSPIPVREALRYLAAERAVTILPNGSVSVPTMTKERFEDLRRTRILVEGFATELAAQNITPREIARLESMYRNGEQLLEKREVRKFRIYSRALRAVIYSATRSNTLLPIIESLWLQVGPFLNLLALDHPLMLSGLAIDHASIDALKKGDGRAAKALIMRDIMEVGDHILQLLPG